VVDLLLERVAAFVNVSDRVTDFLAAVDELGLVGGWDVLAVVEIGVTLSVPGRVLEVLRRIVELILGLAPRVEDQLAEGMYVGKAGDLRIDSERTFLVSGSEKTARGVHKFSRVQNPSDLQEDRINAPHGCANSVRPANPGNPSVSTGARIEFPHPTRPARGLPRVRGFKMPVRFAPRHVSDLFCVCGFSLVHARARVPDRPGLRTDCLTVSGPRFLVLLRPVVGSGSIVECSFPSLISLSRRS
jgi:hypothetical protein